MILAGTGSHKFKSSESVYDIVEACFEQAREIHPHLQIMSGMAEGWDELIARIAINMDLPLIAAVPNPTYGQYYWGSHSDSGENRYKDFEDILEQATEIIVVSQSLFVSMEGKKVHSNIWRNQYMADRADEFLVWDPTSRGTADCVRRIKAANKPYTVIGA